jgi:hypothetical protein
VELKLIGLLGGISGGVALVTKNTGDERVKPPIVCAGRTESCGVVTKKIKRKR